MASRRRFLAASASVATVGLAGCTASAEDGDDVDEFSVRGIEDSEFYGTYEIEGAPLFRLPFSHYGPILALDYGPDAPVDPGETDVYLLDGDEIVSTGDQTQLFGVEETRFKIGWDALQDGRTYRVIVRNPAGILEEFDLEFTYDGGEDGD